MLRQRHTTIFEGDCDPSDIRLFIFKYALIVYLMYTIYFSQVNEHTFCLGGSNVSLHTYRGLCQTITIKIKYESAF